MPIEPTAGDVEGGQISFDPSTATGLGGPLEREAEEKMKWVVSLEALRNQIRRTDVEMRHMTDNRDIKEFETQLLRVLTLSKQLQMVMAYAPIMALGPYGMLFGGTMIGLSAVTSVGVMQELS
jgi:hypothetical protein